MGSVKVVIIETQFVETDALHFKSVVQRLTGMDSVLIEDILERPSVQLVAEEEVTGGERAEWLHDLMPPLPPPPPAAVENLERWLIEPSLQELYDSWAVSTMYNERSSPAFP